VKTRFHVLEIRTPNCSIFIRESKATKNGWAEEVTRGNPVYGELNRCGASPGCRMKKSSSVDKGTIMYSYSVAENSCGIVRRRVKHEEITHGEK
jgi:hypothetical protein